MPFQFDGCVLDERLVELRRDGETVRVEPRVFDVLLYLLANRDRVVAKTELLDVVWGGPFVTESALASCIKQVRQAVGDNGREQRIIKTSHGRGYRFVAVVAPHPDEEAAWSKTERETTTGGIEQERRRTGQPEGREADIDAVRRRFEVRRLVTLVGMGGIGKTYLLRCLDEELASRYRDGSVTVELAPVRSGDMVGPALLSAAPGVDTSGADPTESFLEWLGKRRLLLLIDNAEHVAAEVGKLCGMVLDRCADVDVIVTSRTRLDIPGESVHFVGPLETEPAVALFVKRAFDSGADLDAGHPDLRRLCEKLDGVPLALEIVAARAPLLSIADLTVDLERHLSATNPSGDERHRSLEATLEWSLENLAEQERRLLSDLAVFAGSFDLGAAEAVAKIDDVTESMLDLCRRSLVVPTPDTETSRFRLLEPVRLFAASDGSNVDNTAGKARSQHAAYYRDLAVRTDQLITSHDIDRGMSVMWLEWPNIRAAFDTYSSERDVEAMTSMVNATANYAEARLLAEVYQWADQLYGIAVADSLTPDEVLMANLARFSAHTGELARVDELLADIDPDHHSNHVRMGFVVRDWYQGKTDSVLRILDRALDEVAGDGGYWEATLSVLRLMSTSAVEQRPLHLLDRLESLAGTDGVSGSLFAEIGRGIRIAWRGEPELAVVELDRAVAKAEDLGAAGFAQLIHNLRARTHHAIGEPSRAAAVLAEWIERAVESGGWSMAADSLGSAAAVLTDGDRADVAARILAARQAAGYRFSKRYETALQDRIERALPAADRAENTDRGKQLSLAAAVDLALTELNVLAKTA